jgi:uncharacterized protein (UPF0332 family)
MATWLEMSLDRLEAARGLLTLERWRSSISRSYYFAYCAITEDLSDRGVSYAHGWNNPTHDQLPVLIRHNMNLPVNTRRQLVRAVRRLRLARENADYRPAELIDRSLALACFHDTVFVLNTMGMFDD